MRCGPACPGHHGSRAGVPLPRHSRSGATACPRHSVLPGCEVSTVTFGHTVALPVPLVPSIALFGAIGALSAVLAHRGVSVFHDGLRPVMRSFRIGELSRPEVSRTSFTLAWGFLWAFGLPYSVGFAIPLAYVIFMATDWIGVTVPADYSSRWYRSKRALGGVAQALVLGGVWGAGMALLLRLVTEGMHRLPVDMADPVRLFAQPASGAFFLFAVLTIAYHYDLRRALIALVASSVAWFGARTAGVGQPSVWAFAVATAVLLVFAVREARRSKVAPEESAVAWAVEEDDEEEEDDVFVENVRRIRRSIVPIAVLSALMGAAYNWGVMTNDPISGLLYTQGLAVPAALVGVAWAFAFLPMKFTTAVVTGCMVTHTFLELSVAVLMPNPAWAALACAALSVLQVYLLLPVVRGLEKFPAIREVADVLRTAIFHVMEIGFLVGGALAASAFAGQWGIAVVIMAWFVNSRKNSPVMPISIGAYAALAAGLFANVLALLGLHVH
ncbi:YhfT family protein [Streptomyces sp. NPDC093250]|uniref:YhfT family protein n=1 Tax=Streptomyces sp. NPDC093250 TaxID=3366036 RepID=UPI003808EDEB